MARVTIPVHKTARREIHEPHVLTRPPLRDEGENAVVEHELAEPATMAVGVRRLAGVRVGLVVLPAHRVKVVVGVARLERALDALSGDDGRRIPPGAVAADELTDVSDHTSALLVRLNERENHAGWPVAHLPIDGCADDREPVDPPVR